MSKSVLTSLPQDWLVWIGENLARSCDPHDMVETMVREGRFEWDFARNAIDEASGGKIALSKQPMPDINTSSNRISTSDRVVDVLLTVNAPRIVLLGNVLSVEECDSLVALCTSRLQRSPVVDDGDGSTQVHVSRTSQGAMLQRGETPLVARIEARLAELASWPVKRAEGLQIQQYQATNEYSPHFDWFDPDLPGPRRHMERGGQRLATFVLYLSEAESGGGTSFPLLGLEALPKKGSAVFFKNTDNFHRPDRSTLHAGSPVVRGAKTIANKWLRAGVY